MGYFMLLASYFTAQIDEKNLYSQTFKAWQVTSVPVYQSDFRFLAVSLAVMLVGLMAELLLFWGWWSLERLDVTLSPTETAKSFNAPLFHNSGTENDVRNILSSVGDTDVIYNGHIMVAGGKYRRAGVAP